eukprot:PhF_6_TR16972/c0_g1_i4/m.25650/K07937/ARF1; ADP-ribosylation factor 1
MFNLFRQHRDSTKPASTILTIPHDSLLEIFSFVSDPVELHRLSLVCTLFRDICFDDSLWESHVRRHYLDSKTHHLSMRSLFCAEVIHRGDLRTPSARLVTHAGQQQSIMSKITSLFQKPRQYHIRLLGLDCAGKTTILYKFASQLSEITTLSPTIGFNIEHVQFHELSIKSWDVGNRERIRNLNQYYRYNDVCGVAWVIDSSDKEQLEDSCGHLMGILREDDLRDACVLILWNKCDKATSIPIPDAVAVLGLHYELRNRKWFIQPCCATNGDGLWEGFAWLRSNIRSR